MEENPWFEVAGSSAGEWDGFRCLWSSFHAISRRGHSASLEGFSGSTRNFLDADLLRVTMHRLSSSEDSNHEDSNGSGTQKMSLTLLNKLEHIRSLVCSSDARTYESVLDQLSIAKRIGWMIAERFLLTDGYVFTLRGNELRSFKSLSEVSSEILIHPRPLEVWKRAGVEATGEVPPPVPSLFPTVQFLMSAESDGRLATEVSQHIKTSKVHAILDKLVGLGLAIKRTISPLQPGSAEAKSTQNKPESKSTIFHLKFYCSRFNNSGRYAQILSGESAKEVVCSYIAETLAFHGVDCIPAARVRKVLGISVRKMQYLRGLLQSSEKQGNCPIFFEERVPDRIYRPRASLVHPVKSTWCVILRTAKDRDESLPDAQEDSHSSVGRYFVNNLGLYEQCSAQIEREVRGLTTNDFGAATGITTKKAYKFTNDLLQVFKYPTLKYQEGKTLTVRIQHRSVSLQASSDAKVDIDVTRESGDRSRSEGKGCALSDKQAERAKWVIAFLEAYDGVALVPHLRKYIRDCDAQSREISSAVSSSEKFTPTDKRTVDRVLDRLLASGSVQLNSVLVPQDLLQSDFEEMCVDLVILTANAGDASTKVNRFWESYRENHGSFASLLSSGSQLKERQESYQLQSKPAVRAKKAEQLIPVEHFEAFTTDGLLMRDNLCANLTVYRPPGVLAQCCWLHSCLLAMVGCIDDARPLEERYDALALGSVATVSGTELCGLLPLRYFVLFFAPFALKKFATDICDDKALTRALLIFDNDPLTADSIESHTRARLVGALRDFIDGEYRVILSSSLMLLVATGLLLLNHEAFLRLAQTASQGSEINIECRRAILAVIQPAGSAATATVSPTQQQMRVCSLLFSAMEHRSLLPSSFLVTSILGAGFIVRRIPAGSLRPIKTPEEQYFHWVAKILPSLPFEENVELEEGRYFLPDRIVSLYLAGESFVAMCLGSGKVVTQKSSELESVWETTYRFPLDTIRKGHVFPSVTIVDNSLEQQQALPIDETKGQKKTSRRSKIIDGEELAAPDQLQVAAMGTTGNAIAFTTEVAAEEEPEVEIAIAVGDEFWTTKQDVQLLEVLLSQLLLKAPLSGLPDILKFLTEEEKLITKHYALQPSESHFAPDYKNADLRQLYFSNTVKGIRHSCDHSLSAAKKRITLLLQTYFSFQRALAFVTTAREPTLRSRHLKAAVNSSFALPPASVQQTMLNLSQTLAEEEYIRRRYFATLFALPENVRTANLLQVITLLREMYMAGYIHRENGEDAVKHFADLQPQHLSNYCFSPSFRASFISMRMAPLYCGLLRNKPTALRLLNNLLEGFVVEALASECSAMEVLYLTHLAFCEDELVAFPLAVEFRQEANRRLTLQPRQVPILQSSISKLLDGPVAGHCSKALSRIKAGMQVSKDHLTRFRENLHLPADPCEESSTAAETAFSELVTGKLLANIAEGPGATAFELKNALHPLVLNEEQLKPVLEDMIARSMIYSKRSTVSYELLSPFDRVSLVPRETLAFGAAIPIVGSKRRNQPDAKQSTKDEQWKCEGTVHYCINTYYGKSLRGAERHRSQLAT